MYRLPSDSSINGCIVFHEGNHDNRGLPHEQYINKVPIVHISAKDTGVNKYAKIANINYTLNSNISEYYKLRVFDVAQSIDEHELDIRVTNDITKTTLQHLGSDKVKFYGVQSTTSNLDGTTQYNLDIYMSTSVAWSEYYYVLEIARALNNRLDLGYDDFYAYNHIKLFNGESFLSSITANVNEVIFSDFVIKTNKVRLASDPITAFEVNKLEYFEVSASNSTGFPETQPGLVITYRGSSDAWSYQEYHIRQSNKIYKRFWNTTTNNWDAFVKVSAV